MARHPFRALGIFVLFLVACGIAAAQDRNVSVVPSKGERVALVIGNSAYKQGPLRNPVNDARAISARLRALGFEVVLREDLTTRQIGGSLSEFRSRLKPGAEALFFYAGHGVQIKGVNYLPAVDAEIQTEDDVPTQSIDVGKVIEVMEESKSRLNLVFLDACRDNPFARKFRSGAGGLAKLDAPSGTLISFATRPGSVAADGDGQNGLYTHHLLTQMGVPNLPIEKLLKGVVSGVKKDSNGRQEPWMEGSIEGDFYFVTQGSPGAELPQNPRDPDTEAWLAAESVNAAAAYDAYLGAFPGGRYAAAARIKLAALKGGDQPAVAAPAPAATPGRVFKDCAECPEMVVVPPGSFQMGARHRPDPEKPIVFKTEEPVHEVRIERPFAIGVGHITRGQFAAFVQATGYRTGDRCLGWNGRKWEEEGRSWTNPGFVQTDEHPAVCIAWEDAKAYLQWLAQKTGKAYRLPSEAELEYAIRAGTTATRWWGDNDRDACRYANVGDQSMKKKYPLGAKAAAALHQCSDGHAHTAPAKSFPPNAFGLHDALGNAWQWAEDCWQEGYDGAPADGRAATSGNCSSRVLRGGSFEEIPADIRSAHRFANSTTMRSNTYGFRAALTIR